jgi:hypothetical protein
VERRGVGGVWEHPVLKCTGSWSAEHTHRVQLQRAEMRRLLHWRRCSFGLLCILFSPALAVAKGERHFVPTDDNVDRRRSLLHSTTEETTADGENYFRIKVVPTFVWCLVPKM